MKLRIEHELTCKESSCQQCCTHDDTEPSECVCPHCGKEFDPTDFYNEDNYAEER